MDIPSKETINGAVLTMPRTGTVVASNAKVIAAQGAATCKTVVDLVDALVVRSKVVEADAAKVCRLQRSLERR
jgi:hypothetical protein